ncbi:MAG: polysaccharide biosynthesis protein, partial [Clostridia bacterium]|nr:polysaccharide biosynthesis protein [Clostridia bacterium]
MADSRTKNALRNIGSGSINRFVTLVLPFATRTITLYLLGAKFLGIGTLFSSVLSFLSLTELGLSSAIVYAMYKPVATNDIEAICALLRFYRKLYRIIGIIVLAIGTTLLPAVPFLIKGTPPENINIYVLFYLYLINSVISY